MELEIGSAVELMGVENAGLDITGTLGTVTEIPPSGLISVRLDGSGSIVSAWPENLKIVSAGSSNTQPPQGGNNDGTER